MKREREQERASSKIRRKWENCGVRQVMMWKLMGLDLTMSINFPGGSDGKTSAYNASLVAQRLKRLSAMWETWVLSLGREDSLENKMVTHSMKNPMDRGAWWGIVHGVTKNWTWLSNFTHSLIMWENQIRSLGGKDPLEKEMATHSSTLAWKIPWEEPGRLQSMRSQRVDTTERLYLLTIGTKDERKQIRRPKMTPVVGNANFEKVENQRSIKDSNEDLRREL